MIHGASLGLLVVSIANQQPNTTLGAQVDAAPVTRYLLLPAEPRREQVRHAAPAAKPCWFYRQRSPRPTRT